MTVVIAGGGVAGLAMALTCEQIGVDAVVLESVRKLGPLGVGINLQPNAVRELFDLGLADDLDAIGIETREWALVGRNGNDVWAEPRGRYAGYRWPQYSVHRGQLQMLLLHHVIARMGPQAVRTDQRVVGYETDAEGVRVATVSRDGAASIIEGSLLLGADGLHSAVRAQMHPGQPEPQWGGAVLWRGASFGKPIRTGASFTLVGSMDQRFVHYPIASVDASTGLQLQNWIAEISFDPAAGWRSSDWNRRVEVADFLPAFSDWNFDWLDIPALIENAPAVWEFPMVDRDPVERWVDGRVCLMGDAAHVMYPVGSNGASQAIVDARVMGAQFLEFGITTDALHSFENLLLADMSDLVLRNRGHGPIGVLGVVDERCGGVFDDIDDVIPRAEVERYMSDYKRAAGFARDRLNNDRATIRPGSRVAR